MTLKLLFILTCMIVPLTACIGAFTSCDKADGMRVRSQRTKSGNGRMYKAPDAAEMHNTDGVSGDGPARTHSTALFKLPSLLAPPVPVPVPDPMVDGTFVPVGIEEFWGPEKGLGNAVVVWGWGADSRWG